MDHRMDKTAPDTSTLWLAIGIGGFSVFASFFLAIYCSTLDTGMNATPIEASGLDSAVQAAD